MLWSCLLQQCLLQLERLQLALLLPPGVETTLVLGVGVEHFGLLRLGLRVRSAATGLGLLELMFQFRDAIRHQVVGVCGWEQLFSGLVRRGITAINF